MEHKKVIMKTIVEEASSIFKAIEKGWIKAGKPESFSVKIYEQPQKNFIGMTTRSAKVGIFFNNEPIQTTSSKQEKFERREPRHTQERHQKTERPERKQERSEKPSPVQKQQHQQRPAAPAQPKPQPVVEKKEKSQLEFWTPEMIELSNNWLNTTLDLMNLAQPFTLEPTGHQLRVLFTKPLFEFSEKERQMLRSFSILLLQALRHKFARPLRGFKIILIPSHDTIAR